IGRPLCVQSQSASTANIDSRHGGSSCERIYIRRPLDGCLSDEDIVGHRVDSAVRSRRTAW
ncbi:hypothetical protein PENTCL1PPCAC_29037, partial [Pristionchus entomophagus]